MIRSLDHVVLTVQDIERTVEFYTRVLGMRAVTFDGTCRALHFGGQKFNLQTLGTESRNHARVGSGDVCLLTDWEPKRVLAHLQREGVTMLEGPGPQTGARGEMTSIYFNDPDGNLIEVSTYPD